MVPMILIVAMSLFMNLFSEQIRVYLLRLLTPKKKTKDMKYIGLKVVLLPSTGCT